MLGYVYRMSTHKHPRKMLMWEESAKQRRERSKKTCLKSIREDAGLLEVQDWEERTKDRRKWKTSEEHRIP